LESRGPGNMVDRAAVTWTRCDPHGRALPGAGPGGLTLFRGPAGVTHQLVGPTKGTTGQQLYALRL